MIHRCQVCRRLVYGRHDCSACIELPPVPDDLQKVLAWLKTLRKGVHHGYKGTTAY